MVTHNDSFYLRHIAAIGVNEKVVFREDVYNGKSVKLVEAGMAFNHKLYQLLIGHELLKPLDESVILTNRIGVEDVTSRARELSLRIPHLRALLLAQVSNGALFDAIAGIELGDVLANLLSVMQKRFPDAYDHSIQVAMVACAIGLEMKLSAASLKTLAMAGLLHDVGELYIDPSLLDAKTPLGGEGWRQIYFHPEAAYRVLLNSQEVPELVAQAVLEHHERVDGSGYPNNAVRDGLCWPGRILAAADVIIAILQKEKLSHAGTVFKSYVNLDGAVTKAANGLLLRMHAVLKAKALILEDQVDMNELKAMCATTSRVMRAWALLARKLEQNPMKRVQRLQVRLSNIEGALRNAGLDPGNCEDSLGFFSEDPVMLHEAACLLREVNYQFGVIVSEIKRNWNFVSGNKSTTTMAVEKWVLYIEGVLAAQKEKLTPFSVEAPMGHVPFAVALPLPA